MLGGFRVWIVLAAAPVWAQLPVCPETPVWSPCDLAFALEAGENAAQVELRAEFRSPRHKTYLMRAFQDGERRLVIRFAPTETGDWEYRLTSSLPRLDGKTGQFTAPGSESPGFVRVANVHHLATENSKPHLWMATALDRFTAIPRPEFDQIVEQRLKEKFTHLRVTIEPGVDLRDAAERVRAMNAKGLVADVVLA